MCVSTTGVAQPAPTGPWTGELRNKADGAPPLAGEGAILGCADDTSRASHFSKSKALFTDRTYRPSYDFPEALKDAVMLQSSILAAKVTCIRDGVVFVVTPSPDRGGDSQASSLIKLGFQKMAVPEFHLFNTKNHDICTTYQKKLTKGEELSLGKWSVILSPAGGGIQFTGPVTGAAIRTGKAPEFEVPVGEAATFETGAKVFTNRNFTLSPFPAALEDCSFLRTSIDELEFTCTSAGLAYIVTPTPRIDGAASLDEDLAVAGFEKTELPRFQLFGTSPIDVCRVYQKELQVGERIRTGKWGVLVVPGKLRVTVVPPPAPTPWTENRGELLYNGIRLPEQWPPRTIDRRDNGRMPVPYLDHVPDVLPINVGRQLFVDDFLIQETTLTRKFHLATKYEGNPILEPETELEGVGVDGVMPAATPKDGGVWWDPDMQCYRMWYEAGWLHRVAYATSADGIHWDRPELEVTPGTNQVLPLSRWIRPDSWNVVPDPHAKDPSQRWKMLLRCPGGQLPAQALTSPDGLHWSEPQMGGYCGDRTSMFYNPFRRVWVYSIRAGWRARSRTYHEHKDFLTGARWLKRDPVLWAAADELDPPDPAIGVPAQLYNLDAQAYESLMLGVFEIHLGPPNEVCEEGQFPKTTELMLAYSRDGFHWSRPDRRAFIPAGREAGTWDRGYVQPVGGICLVMGDRLWFYYSAFSGTAKKVGDKPQKRGIYCQGATGLAFLRRDGFASMEADAKGGTLLTRPVTFSGKHLFVNLAAPAGSVRVEVLDEAGTPIAPFTLDNCIAATGDSTLQRIEWKGDPDLAKLVGKPVRLRFHLMSGALYAFWVSPEANGASHGYVGAGGPGFTGWLDTVGKGNYAATAGKQP